MNPWIPLPRWAKRRLTLRVRLMLWVTGLLFVLVIGLLVFINITTPITATKTRVMTLVFPSGMVLPTDIDANVFGSSSSGPVKILSTKVVESSSPDEQLIEVEVLDSVVERDIFHQMRVISFIGLLMVMLLGGLGSYWLAGRALHPVHALAEAAQGIDAKTLDTRLNLEGPEDEMKRLAGSFNDMMDRLEYAFEQQSQFVADAAHELRTPLTTLRASLDVVSMEPKATAEDYRAMNDTLKRALSRLQRLVDDLLLLATEEYTLPNTSVIIGPIAEEVLFDLKPLANAYSVTVRLTGRNDLMIRGDSALLARVFHNLVENGIRYGRKDGTVLVDIRSEGEWAVIVVTDNGIGIPLENQPHIFERFYRVDMSRSRHNGGAGLGLAIAAHIVQLHGGRIEVQSTVGIGSTFIVKLPL